MSNIRFSSVVTTVLVLMAAGIILFYPGLGLTSQSQIKLLSDGINSIMKALNIKRIFTPNDVIGGLIFTEYAVFGALLMAMLKTYTVNIAKNISIPLFIGLSVAVLSGYISKFWGLGVASLEVVVHEFFCLLTGIFIYLILGWVLENKLFRGKYSKRR